MLISIINKVRSIELDLTIFKFIDFAKKERIAKLYPQGRSIAS